MLKKIIFTILFVLFISPVYAKNGVNIFTYPREVPNIKIFDQYGKAFSLKDFNNKFLIVVFWSKSCVPCIREIDDINEFIKKTHGSDLKLIMVSSEKEWLSPEEQKTFLKRYHGEDIEFYTDRKSSLANNFGIFTSPHTVLINKNSLEIGRIRGSVDWDDDDVIEYMYRLNAEH